MTDFTETMDHLCGAVASTLGMDEGVGCRNSSLGQMNAEVLAGSSEGRTPVHSQNDTSRRNVLLAQTRGEIISGDDSLLSYDKRKVNSTAEKLIEAKIYEELSSDYHKTSTSNRVDVASDDHTNSDIKRTSCNLDFDTGDVDPTDGDLKCRSRTEVSETTYRCTSMTGTSDFAIASYAYTTTDSHTTTTTTPIATTATSIHTPAPGSHTTTSMNITVTPDAYSIAVAAVFAPGIRTTTTDCYNTTTAAAAAAAAATTDTTTTTANYHWGHFGQQRQDYLTWEEYFMSVAFLSAQRSKDPVSQVGACIVNSYQQIVGIGYNGMPQGCADSVMPWGKTSQDPLENKYMFVCHAEMNAILNKNSADVRGCTIYVALFPCNECAKLIIQAGIREVIYYSDKHSDKKETIASKMLLDMTHIKYRPYASGRRRLVLDFNAVTARYPAAGAPAGGKGTPDRSPNSPRSAAEVLSWSEYFMAVAFLSAQRSKDPFEQVGACIVNPAMRIVGIGYNGMPTGCQDSRMPWKEASGDSIYSKQYYVCHAEMNAILNKNSADVRGCTIYVALFPCNECAKLIIQAGIREVIYYSDKKAETIPSKAAKELLRMANVVCHQYSECGKNFRVEVSLDFELIEQ